MRTVIIYKGDSFSNRYYLNVRDNHETQFTLFTDSLQDMRKAAIELSNRQIENVIADVTLLIQCSEGYSNHNAFFAGFTMMEYPWLHGRN